MGTRSAALQISRPIQFRPFTSLTTPAQDTKTPDFEFVIPRLDDATILLSATQWPTTRFVYIFIDQARLVAGPPTLELAALSLLVGPGATGNPLLAVIQVDPTGKQSVCTGSEYKQASTAGSPPPFKPMSGVETVGIEPETLTAKLGGSYAIAAPILLQLPAIASLEAARPAVVPILGTGMSVGVDATATASPTTPTWVFPIVDPLFIAENLARKFYEAADNFLSASQQIDRPPAANDAEQQARARGEVLRFKKTVADNLIALKGAAPSLAANFSSNLQQGFPENFNQDYDRSLSDLAFARELAAFQLVAWLESDLFVLADDWWDRNQGKPNADYDFYLRAVLSGLARLAEADRGVQYLMDLRNRIEQGTSPMPSGVLNVTNEFIFRSTQSSAEQLVLAIKASAVIFSTWSNFVTAALSVRQRVVKGPNPTTSLVNDLQAFASRLNFVFQGNVLTLSVSSVPVEAAIPGSIKTTVVNVPLAAFQIGPGRAAIQKTKLTTAHMARVFAVLNFGACYAALRAALTEGGDARAKDMAISDLAGASFGVLDQGLSLPILEAFRRQIAGKLDMGGALLGNRVSSVLGLLTAVATLVSASLATADAYDKGDWNLAVSHITEGIGAVISGVGSTVILVSGATGPFALWAIGIGTAITTAGFLWSIFAADTEIDQMLKFCAFGNQVFSSVPTERRGQGALKPPGWSQCVTSFDEWDAGTVQGLLLQLKAFQQIFYSFEASGAVAVQPGPLASDGILRLTPASLRLACSFEVTYTAVYSVLGSAGQKTTLNGQARVLIQKTPSASPTLVDAGGNYETVGAIRVHSDGGRDALDIRLRLTTPLFNAGGAPLELETLTCLVQLSIPGNKVDDIGSKDDTLIVPTTAKGAQQLSVVPVRRRNLDTAPVLSVKVP